MIRDSASKQVWSMSFFISRLAQLRIIISYVAATALNKCDSYKNVWFCFSFHKALKPNPTECRNIRLILILISDYFVQNKPIVIEERQTSRYNQEITHSQALVPRERDNNNNNNNKESDCSRWNTIANTRLILLLIKTLPSTRYIM